MLDDVVNLANYAFSVYAVPTLVTAVAIMLLGVVVFIRERSAQAGLLFLVVVTTISIWLFSFSWMYCALEERVALWWAKAAYVGVPLMPSAIIHFEAAVLGVFPRYRRWIWASWLLAIGFVMAALATDSLIHGLYHYWWGYYPRYGWLSLPYMIFFFSLMVLSLRLFWVGFRQALPGSTAWRRQRLLLVGFSIIYLGVFDYVAKYGIPLYPFGYLPVLAFVVLAGRAIWHYHLVDLTPAFAAEQILRTMTDALLVLDREGIVRVANQAACFLFRRPESELVGQPVARLGDGALPRQLELLIQTGAVQACETTVPEPGGGRLVLDIATSVIPDRAGQTVGFVCLARDVTRRTLAEEARREAEARYRHVVEHAVEGIFQTSVDGRILMANPALATMLGYTSPEALIRDVRDVKWLYVEPSRRDELLRLIDAHGSVSGFELQLRRKDGGTIWVSGSIRAIRDATGKLAGLEGVAIDITARRQTETERSRLASIVETSTDAIVSYSLDGLILSWNPAAERIFGYGTQEMIGHPLTVIVPSGRHEELEWILDRVKQGERIEPFETVWLAKDRRRVDVFLSTSPTTDASGQIVGCSAICRDITERKRLEQEILEISEREQQRIGQDVHDELSQHLTGIALLCKALERKLLPAAPAESTQAGQIANLVDQALMKTRELVQGLYPAMIAERGLVEALRELASQIEATTHVSCQFRSQTSIDVRDPVVTLHLYRIAQEATSNAIKHGKASRLAMALAFNDDGLTLAVEDDGIGMPSEGRRGSVGMGLRIMEHRAKMIGASLTVRRRVEGGTLVRCHVPHIEGLLLTLEGLPGR